MASSSTSPSTNLFHSEKNYIYVIFNVNNLFRYLKRFDEELEHIQSKHSIGHRKNRQHASREDVIKLTKKHEEEEYKTCGIGNKKITFW